MNSQFSILMIVALLSSCASLKNSSRSEATEADRSQAQKVLRDKGDSFRRCYDEAGRSDPLLGQLTVEYKLKFEINKDGGVDSVEISSRSYKDGGLEDCIVNAARNISFSKSDDGFAVDHSLLFRPSQTKK